MCDLIKEEVSQITSTIGLSCYGRGSKQYDNPVLFLNEPKKIFNI
jgi:hypothetical protein